MEIIFKVFDTKKKTVKLEGPRAVESLRITENVEVEISCLGLKDGAKKLPISFELL